MQSNTRLICLLVALLESTAYAIPAVLFKRQGAPIIPGPGGLTTTQGPLLTNQQQLQQQLQQQQQLQALARLNAQQLSENVYRLQPSDTSSTYSSALVILVPRVQRFGSVANDLLQISQGMPGLLNANSGPQAQIMPAASGASSSQHIPNAPKTSPGEVNSVNPAQAIGAGPNIQTQQLMPAISSPPVPGPVVLPPSNTSSFSLSVMNPASSTAGKAMALPQMNNVQRRSSYDDLERIDSSGSIARSLEKASTIVTSEKDLHEDSILPEMKQGDPVGRSVFGNARGTARVAAVLNALRL